MSLILRGIKWLLIAYVILFVLFNLAMIVASDIRQISYVKAHSEISAEIKRAILKGRVIPGMTRDELKASWGEGDLVMTSVHPDGEIRSTEVRRYSRWWHKVTVCLANGSVAGVAASLEGCYKVITGSLAKGEELPDQESSSSPPDLGEGRGEDVGETLPLDEEPQKDVGPLPFLQAFIDRLQLWQEPGTELTDMAITRCRPYSSTQLCLIALFSGSVGVLEVYKVTGEKNDKVRLIGKEVFESFSILNLKRIEDINRDGFEEIVIEGWNGGNCWVCSGLAIFQIRDDQLLQLSPNIPYWSFEEGFFKGRIDDVDGDGRKELLLQDIRFEFAFNFSHGASPTAWIIYAWKDCCYEKAASEYDFYYDEQIRRLEQRAQEAYDDANLEGYLSDLISILINRVLKGEGEEGWSEFLKAIDTPEFHQRWKKYRDDYPVLSGLDDIIATVRHRLFED